MTKVEIPDHDKRTAKSEGKVLEQNGASRIEKADPAQQPRADATPSVGQGQAQQIGQST